MSIRRACDCCDKCESVWKIVESSTSMRHISLVCELRMFLTHPLSTTPVSVPTIQTECTFLTSNDISDLHIFVPITQYEIRSHIWMTLSRVCSCECVATMLCLQTKRHFAYSHLSLLPTDYSRNTFVYLALSPEPKLNISPSLAKIILFQSKIIPFPNKTISARTAINLHSVPDDDTISASGHLTFSLNVNVRFYATTVERVGNRSIGRGNRTIAYICLDLNIYILYWLWLAFPVCVYT